MKDYLKGKIYKIVCNITGLTYIGSTCEPTLARRLAKHVGNYREWINGKNHFITSFKIIEGGNYDIILVEECPCESSDQLHARERHHIETVNCVNKYMPGLNYRMNKNVVKEYNSKYKEANKENIREKDKKYYVENKIQINEKSKQYRETNKEKIKEYRGQKIICLCGIEYTRCHKSRHEKTKKHQDYVNSQEI